MRLKLVSSLIALGIVATLATGTAHAQLFNSFSTAGALAGNQSFTGNMGIDFTVNQTLAITDIGIFDANNDGLAPGTTIKVGIYSLDGLGNGTLVGGTSSTFTSASSTFSRAGSYIFQHLTSVSLAPGNYSIMAVGYNGTDQNYNSGGGPSAISLNNGSGLISFGNNRWNTATNGVPSAGDLHSDGNPLTPPQPDRFGAVSFTFGLIPEPGTMALLGMAALPFGMALRRRRK